MGDVALDGLRHALEAERKVEPGGNLRASWEALLADARKCTRCELYKFGTQTVFGEGPLDASIMFVGEQPGDQEDLAGRPFVGPAGQLFDAALDKAGIDRSTVYVTNAVKHFKFIQRGKCWNKRHTRRAGDSVIKLLSGAFIRNISNPIGQAGRPFRLSNEYFSRRVQESFRQRLRGECSRADA